MFLLNKNITHDGHSYPSGSEIKKSDSGFNDLLKSGHINESVAPNVEQVAIACPILEESKEESQPELRKQKFRK